MSTTQPSRGAAATAVAGLLALAAAMGIGRFAYTPILPFMEEALDLSKSEAGVIASANYLGYLLGALGVARRGLPGGRRRWLIGGLAASTVTTAVMGVTDSFTLFLAVRFVGGVASAVVLVVGSALVLDRLVTARQPSLFAVHFAGVGLGIAGSAVLVAALDAADADWSTMWISGAAVSAVALLVVSSVIVPGGGHEPGDLDADHPKLARALVRLIAAYGLFGFGYVITATFINTLVRETPAVSHLEGVIWLVVGLAAAPSVALWGWVGRRLGMDRSFALACLVEAVGVSLPVLTENAAGVLLGAALLGGTFVGISAVGLVAAQTLTPGDARRGIALMTAAFGVGQMIGPSFAGNVRDSSGSFLVPSLTAAVALVVAAIMSRDVLGTDAAPGP